jgi:glycosyltransferase involved in cell wall biosynthesis
MSSASLPGFSVIIPTYNREQVTARTIRHFIEQDYPADRYEVIVVDNSTDETPRAVEALAADAPCSIRLLRTPVRLPAVKRNFGLAAATFEYALFFNDDVWVEPQLLREHARTHMEHAEPVAVLGLVEQSPEMTSNPFLEQWVPFAYHEIADRADAAVPYRYFWSMNLSLPRQEMLDRNLVFHEDWAEIGHEDIELGYRWTQAGREIIYNPRARGWHFHPMTLGSACAHSESMGRGLRDLFRLVPDPGLFERYMVFNWRSSPRALRRGLVRQLLFNGLTVPHVRAWLERRKRNSTLTRFLYWKVLLFYLNRGYRSAPDRDVRPRLTRAPVAERLGA